MGKKENIIKAATRLFAKHGFDATTTLQIAAEADVTEPLIYYHFKGKDALFTHIINTAFSDLFARLDTIKKNTATEFEKIRQFVTIYFQFVDEMPEETYLIVNARPSKLKDPEHVCSKNIHRFCEMNTSFLNECLSKGVQSGEFICLQVKETANLIAAMINGLLRQKTFNHNSKEADMHNLFIEFCQRSLLKT